MSSHLITRADHGTTVDVGRGDVVTLSLPENPTTGYRWSLDEHDAAALEPTGSASFQPAGSAVGTGGERSFSFIAKAPGEYSLALSRRRPWERQTPAKENFRVTLRVHE